MYATSRHILRCSNRLHCQCHLNLPKPTLVSHRRSINNEADRQRNTPGLAKRNAMFIGEHCVNDQSSANSNAPVLYRGKGQRHTLASDSETTYERERKIDPWSVHAGYSVIRQVPSLGRVMGLRTERCLLMQARRCQPILQTRHASTYLASFLDSAPVHTAQNVMQSIHDTSGLPWWASIVVTTCLLRSAITLPLAIYQAHILAKVEGLQPEIKTIAEGLKKEVSVAKKMYKWGEKTTRLQFKINMRRHVGQLYVRDNCHPAKATLLMWVQLPMWFSLSFALRNMSGAFSNVVATENVVLVSDLATEGALWFSNLLLPDPSLVIPIALGVINLAIIEMNSLTRQEQTRMMKGLTWFLRGISCLMVPIAMTVPSCLSLYWVSSSTFGLVQNVALKFPSVRRACRIPPAPSESQTPFRDMVAHFRARRARADASTKDTSAST